MVHQTPDDETSRWAESDAAVEAVLRARAAAGPRSGTGDSRAAVAALLELATADDTEGRALVRRAGGRPTLDPHDPSDAGPSPVWNVRAPRSLDNALRDLAAREGLKFADVLRQAAAEYVDRHQVVG